jgi:hypothetical protein
MLLNIQFPCTQWKMKINRYFLCLVVFNSTGKMSCIRLWCIARAIKELFLTNPEMAAQT